MRRNLGEDVIPYKDCLRGKEIGFSILRIKRYFSQAKIIC